MTIFLISPLDDNSENIKSVLSTEKLDFFQMEKGGFFVNFHGTAKELSEKIGITKYDPVSEKTTAAVGRAIVMHAANWWGYGPADMWEWLKTRAENG